MCLVCWLLDGHESGGLEEAPDDLLQLLWSETSRRNAKHTRLTRCIDRFFVCEMFVWIV